MKTLLLISLFSNFMTAMFGQSLLATANRFMAYKQNQNWLMSMKTSDKENQWTGIKKRYFRTESINTPHDSIQYSPLIVVNGVPIAIPDHLPSGDLAKIFTLLDDDPIREINIIENVSAEWIFCKPFSGVIIITVNKRTNKKLFDKI